METNLRVNIPATIKLAGVMAATCCTSWHRSFWHHPQYMRCCQDNSNHRLLPAHLLKKAWAVDAAATTTFNATCFILAQVLLIPGDTFRAAAAEQLTEWAKRGNAIMGDFIEGATPQAVITTVSGVPEHSGMHTI